MPQAIETNGAATKAMNKRYTTTNLVPVEVKKNVLGVQQIANSLSVTDPASAEKASELRHNIKEAMRQLTEKKTDITRPIMDSLAKIKALFAPYELMLKNADTTVDAKLLSYKVEEQDRIDTAKAKVVARAEKGTLRSETAVKKLGKIGEAKKTAGTRLQSRRVVDIVDESLLPREYMVPDRLKISKALFAGIDVFGARLVEEKHLVDEKI